MAAMAPTAANAETRGLPAGKMVPTMAKIAGIMSADPRPSSSDQPTIIIGSAALNAVIRAPRPYIEMPMVKVARRPHTSPSLPPISMNDAMTRE